MKQLWRFIRMALWGVAVAVAVFIVFLLVAVVSDYRPEDCEAVYAYSADGGDAGLAGDSRQGIRSGMDSAAVVQLGCDAQNGEDSLGSFHSEAASKNSAAQITDSLKIVTWNIGYGGLGSNMDFFYDGGTRIRDTKARTLENLEGVLAEMKALDADIYLLQEVDECSRRTYRINELAIPLVFCSDTFAFAHGEGVQRRGYPEPLPGGKGGEAGLSVPFPFSSQPVQSEAMPVGGYVPLA